MLSCVLHCVAVPPDCAAHVNLHTRALLCAPIVVLFVQPLQDRPAFSRDVLNWDDHSCDKLYVPPLLNATAVTVPGWIYNATAA
jgi:hypothetical protein